MDIKIVNSLCHKKWIKFVESHPHGNIFHTPYMMEIYKRTKNHNPILFAALSKADDRILALVPATQQTVIGGPIETFATRSVLYGGVLCEQSDEGAYALKELISRYDEYARKKSLFTEIRNMSHPQFYNQSLLLNRYEYEDYLNYLIDLNRSPLDIFCGFSKDKREGVKRAEREGVTVEEITQKDKMPILYNIISETYSRIKIPLAHISLFESSFDILFEREAVKFFLVRYKDKYIGARVSLFFKTTIFAWYACSLRHFSNLHANELSLWHVLKSGANNGFQLFDFGGAGKPNEKYGVREFKKRFGGREVNFGRFKKVYSPFALKLSAKAYNVYRRFL